VNPPLTGHQAEEIDQDVFRRFIEALEAQVAAAERTWRPAQDS
jgi:hypothetical protein